MGFEWDPEKERRNIGDHGLDFDKASKIVSAHGFERRSDRRGEARWQKTGEMDGKLWTVVFTKRGKNIRVISARRARKNEDREYRAIQPRGDRGEN